MLETLLVIWFSVYFVLGTLGAIHLMYIEALS